MTGLAKHKHLKETSVVWQSFCSRADASIPRRVAGPDSVRGTIVRPIDMAKVMRDMETEDGGWWPTGCHADVPREGQLDLPPCY